MFRKQTEQDGENSMCLGFLNKTKQKYFKKNITVLYHGQIAATIYSTALWGQVEGVGEV